MQRHKGMSLIETLVSLSVIAMMTVIMLTFFPNIVNKNASLNEAFMIENHVEELFARYAQDRQFAEEGYVLSESKGWSYHIQEEIIEQAEQEELVKITLVISNKKSGNFYHFVRMSIRGV